MNLTCLYFVRCLTGTFALTKDVPDRALSMPYPNLENLWCLSRALIRSLPDSAFCFLPPPPVIYYSRGLRSLHRDRYFSFVRDQSLIFFPVPFRFCDGETNLCLSYAFSPFSDFSGVKQPPLCFRLPPHCIRVFFYRCPPPPPLPFFF